MMGSRTKFSLPVSGELLKPESVDVDKVISEIKIKRQISETCYDKRAGFEHSRLDIGSHVYVKPSPQKRGDPWTFWEVINLADRSYTIKTST